MAVPLSLLKEKRFGPRRGRGHAIGTVILAPRVVPHIVTDNTYALCGWRQPDGTNGPLLFNGDFPDLLPELEAFLFRNAKGLLPEFHQFLHRRGRFFPLGALGTEPLGPERPHVRAPQPGSLESEEMGWKHKKMLGAVVLPEGCLNFIRPNTGNGQTTLDFTDIGLHTN